MRSSSRPGPWRPVNAFAWWNRALSRTTAILPVPVSRWSRSSARIVCSVFRFCSVGCGVTVLLVGEGGAEERLGRPPPVHGPLWCAAPPGAACGGSRPRARGGPQSCGVDLPALVQQAFDSGRRLGHASGDGFLVAVLVERVRVAQGSARRSAGAAGTKNPPGTRHRTGSSRRHVSPGRPRTRRGCPPGRVAGRGFS